MRRKVNQISLVLLFLGYAAISAAGGGWTKKKGLGYYKLSEYWLIANKHYTDQGLLDPNVTTGVFITSLYGEYGLNDKWTLEAYVPFLSRNYTNNVISSTTGETITAGEAINTIGDIDLSFKYGLLQNSKIVVAPSLKLGIPIGKTDGGQQGNLQTGDGEFNQYLRVDASTAWKVKGQTIYTNLYAGYNNRTNDFSDEFRAGGELGFGLWKERIWFIGRLDNVSSMQNGLPSSASNGTSIFANNSEYLSYGYEGAIKINDKWGVSASYSSVIDAKLILASPAYTVGVFLEVK